MAAKPWAFSRGASAVFALARVHARGCQRQTAWRANRAHQQNAAAQRRSAAKIISYRRS